MKIAFAGTPEFAAGHLQALIDSHHEVTVVITQPDRPGKRGRKPVAGPVKQLATSQALTCLQPYQLTSDDLSGFDFELLVVVAYGQILKPDVLQLPHHGCINVHASALPRWRGAAPVQRAILAGDQETGVTLIQMDEGLDTGDMLAMETITIESGDTAGVLFEKMLACGSSLLIDTINAIESGTAAAEPQADAGSCYASKLEKDEACIDWHMPAAAVDRMVRAFNPDPVAYTWLDNMRVRIHQGRIEKGSGTHGQVLEVTKEGILIACGEDAYRVTSIQLPFGKGAVLGPADVLNGRTDILHAGVQLKTPQQ